MPIDIPTVVFMIAFMQLVCGAILIAAYFYYRDTQAAAWWGLSHIVLAAGVLTSMTGGLTGNDRITAAAFVLFLTCAAMQWHGTRVLTGAKSYLPLVLVGPVLIATVNLLPAGSALPMVRGIVASVLNVSYFAGALFVLVRPPGERLIAYRPLALLFVANIIVIALGPFGSMGTTEGGLPPLLSLSGLIHLEGQLFVLGTTVFVIVALRERSEVQQRSAARTDSLTGLANRRDFFDSATRLLERARKSADPVALVNIDLDNFKSANDSFGHATGDAVLRTFAVVARRTLRPGDLLGRIGGEEFALLLYGSGPEAAVAIAERLRRSFEAEAQFVDGSPVRCTLCAGVAEATTDTDLDTVFRQADAALYRGKRNGRNRVELFGDVPPDQDRVVRVA